MNENINMLLKRKYFLMNEKINMNNKIKHIEQKLYYIDKFLNENCNHKWITDYIDISLDQSKQIIYCSICELNKPISL